MYLNHRNSSVDASSREAALLEITHVLLVPDSRVSGPKSREAAEELQKKLL